MVSGLEFEWDDAKAASNLAKHGVPFAFATRIFLDPQRAEFDVSRQADREGRRKAAGVIEGRLFTVVFTYRGDRVRIISARRSNSNEERAYGASHP
jgi:uncharacterized DUF497 family protein